MIGLLIVSSRSEADEVAIRPNDSYFELLEQRIFDVQFSCRCKVLQTFSTIIGGSNCLPLVRRFNMLRLACDRLQDKTSFVRKRACLLLKDLIESHPFVLDGGDLDMDFFKLQSEKIQGELNVCILRSLFFCPLLVSSFSASSSFEGKTSTNRTFP
jgi:hypothetical protein